MKTNRNLKMKKESRAKIRKGKNCNRIFPFAFESVCQFW